MKKLILLSAFLLGFTLLTTAQVDKRALGVRLGYGGEISYQHPLGSANRLEVDMGLNNWGNKGWGTNLTGVYQWVWSLDDLADGINWYAGVGGVAGLKEKSFGAGVVGQVGIEYHFDIPLMLSLDYRPSIFVVPTVFAIYDGISLSARYKF